MTDEEERAAIRLRHRTVGNVCNCAEVRLLDELERVEAALHESEDSEIRLGRLNETVARERDELRAALAELLAAQTAHDNIGAVNWDGPKLAARHAAARDVARGLLGEQAAV
jgi:hypothetical protein